MPGIAVAIAALQQRSPVEDAAVAQCGPADGVPDEPVREADDAAGPVSVRASDGGDGDVAAVMPAASADDPAARLSEAAPIVAEANTAGSPGGGEEGDAGDPTPAAGGASETSKPEAAGAFVRLPTPSSTAPLRSVRSMHGTRNQAAPQPQSPKMHLNTLRWVRRPDGSGWERRPFNQGTLVNARQRRHKARAVRVLRRKRVGKRAATKLRAQLGDVLFKYPEGAGPPRPPLCLLQVPQRVDFEALI